MEWRNKLKGWYEEATQKAYRAGMFGKSGESFRPCPRFEEIRVDVSIRASRKAGVCWAGQRRIWLHGAQLEKDARETFIHELAHLFSYMVEGHGGHGEPFRRWDRAMGGSGSRCHSIQEVIETKRGDWAHCPRCRKEFKKVWRAPITSYFCRGCRKSIVPGRLQPTPTPTPVAASAPPPNPVDTGVPTLLVRLALLHEQGLASTPEGSKIRRQLRALGHRGGMR